MNAVLATVLLALVYVTTTGRAAAGDWLVALLAGAAVTALAAPGGDRPGLIRRVTGAPLLLFGAVVAVAAGAWKMTRVLLGVDRSDQVGNVEVPLGERTRTGARLSALIATMSPATVAVEIDHERRIMIINAIDASDPDAIRADLQRFYERYQRRFQP